MASFTVNKPDNSTVNGVPVLRIADVRRRRNPGEKKVSGRASI